MIIENYIYGIGMHVCKFSIVSLFHMKLNVNDKKIKFFYEYYKFNKFNIINFF